MTGVTVSSTPAAGTTYLGGEAIEFTATFTASVTVTGTPTFAFTLGEAEREAAYASGSDTAELVFSLHRAGGRDRYRRHLVECERARPRRRDRPADHDRPRCRGGRGARARERGRTERAPGGRRPAGSGVGEHAGDGAGAALRRGARFGLGASRDCLHPDGGFGAEPAGLGRRLRQHGDTDLRVGAGRGRDGDAGLHGAGVEPGEGRGGQRRAGVHRPDGGARASGDETSTSERHRRRDPQWTTATPRRSSRAMSSG